MSFAAQLALYCHHIRQDDYQTIARRRYLPGLYDGSDELSPHAIVERYSAYSDIFVSHDWGRELGVDNHARVVEAGSSLRKMGLRAHVDNFGMLENNQVKQMIEGAQCGIVFVTRRYIRRYEGKHYLSEEYDHIINTMGYDRVIFVLMERRMMNRTKWASQLRIPTERVENLNVLEMFIEEGVDMLAKNISTLYNAVLQVIDIPLLELTRQIYMKSYESIFAAAKDSTPSTVTALTVFLATDENSGGAIRFIDNEGSTLLHHAAASGSAAIVGALLSHTAMTNVLNLQDQSGSTALFAAASRGQVEVVRLLLSAGADPDRYTKEGHSPLYEAALNGHLEVITALIEAKADINLADTDGLLPMDVTSNEEIRAMLSAITATHKQLLSIAKAGDVEALHALLQHHPNLNVNFEDEDGRTALFLAAAECNAPMVRHLLAAKADVHVRDNWLDTPLAVACFYAGSDVEIVQILLDAGSDVHSKNAWGNTALHNRLHYTVHSSEVAGAKMGVLELLLARGADVNDPGTFEGVVCTPVQVAMKKAAYKMLQLLLEAGALVDQASAEAMLSDHTVYLQPVSEQGVSFLSLRALSVNDYALWFKLLQLEPADEAQDLALQSYTLSVVKVHPQLAEAKDEHGRVAADVATKANKAAINSHFLWHGRYRIIEQHPEHVSATCYVYRALDENSLDEGGHPVKVALKLIRLKAHFIREIQSRKQNFDPAYVVSILGTYPALSDASGDLNAMLHDLSEDCFAVDNARSLTQPETATLKRLRQGETVPQLSKLEAELMYCIVMPLADRNMFVCLKQERFAGKLETLDEISYVFLQLVRCVEHMHSKGIIHADLKTLNMVRSGANWHLIDLDAACEVGVDSVGFKASSAYIPPEAIYANKALKVATVRNVVNKAKFEEKYNVTFDLLIAQPSFDVWSLGCILYQLCTPDVRPLFQGGQDDNLTDNATDQDNNLFAVAEWSDSLKTRKLVSVIHPLARNLLSQMLHKDPLKRPTIERVLAHPFLSKKQYTRLAGQDAGYDVFISYRVASDLQHAERLYELLTASGARVWWDKRCLKAGVNWEQGFCSGLVNSRYFVSILSRGAINEVGNKRQNFGLLEAESPCDNVLLEMRLALELHQLGFIEKIFPLFIGDVRLGPDGDTYGQFFEAGCLPGPLASVAVNAVERNVVLHLEEEGLGSPLLPNLSVKATLDAVLKCNGAKIEGDADMVFASAVSYLLSDEPVQSLSTKLSRGFSSRKPSADFSTSGRFDPTEGAPLASDEAMARAVSKVLQIRDMTTAAAGEEAGLVDLEAEAAVLKGEIARLNAYFRRNLELQSKLRNGSSNAAKEGKE